MVQAHELFLGFVRYYNSLNIHVDETASTRTNRILSYYDELGRMLGYRISSEITMNNLIENAPKSLSKMKMDLVWWRKLDEQNYEYELGLESQDSPNMQKIRQDIRKLSYLPSNNLLLYCSFEDTENIIKLLKRDFLKYGSNHSQFLTIIDAWTDKTAFDEGVIRAILINKQGDLLGEGYAKPSSIRDNDNYLRILSEAKWMYK